jgi:hypothetical protein
MESSGFLFGYFADPFAGTRKPETEALQQLLFRAFVLRAAQFQDVVASGLT